MKQEFIIYKEKRSLGWGLLGRSGWPDHRLTCAADQNSQRKKTMIQDWNDGGKKFRVERKAEGEFGAEDGWGLVCVSNIARNAKGAK